MALISANAPSEQSQDPTDWSVWGGLAPQFLLAPFFPRRPQPTIMLAIADETTLNALNVALTNAGYVVFTAATAREALGVLRTPATPMDAAVVDVNLPDVSGVHLVGRLKELFPWLPVMIYANPADGTVLASLREMGVQVLLHSSATSDMLAQVRALVS
jgi:DNA-binding response OmpR family regulator